jgi:hypothetical protein
MKKIGALAIICLMILVGTLTGLSSQVKSAMHGPDLIVVEGSIEKHYTIGFGWYVTAEIRNKGDTDIDGCFNTYFFLDDYDYCIGSPGTCYLDAGESTTVQSDYFDASGIHTIIAYVDYEHEIDETNEYNNEETEEFYFTMA